MLNKAIIAAAAAALICCAGAVCTSAHAQEGERLPWGALKAGNKDGSIPAYTGGLPTSTNPPGFKKDSGFWVDPFASDKPLYTVTGKNADQYADKLSDGTKEVLKRFPGFKLDVYPTRRSAAFPDWVVENMKKNAAGRCKLIENGEAVEGCFGGIPFPVPKNGNELMWNLMLNYKGKSAWYSAEGWYSDATGNQVLVNAISNRGDSPYYDKDLTPEAFYKAGGPYFNNSNIYSAPARIAGEGNLLRKWANPIANPDKTWNYSPGQRRVRLSPDAAYDFPIASSGGVANYDEIFMFSGRLDRYDWKLLGLREMLVPYNTYRFYNSKPSEVLAKQHINPDVLRWELHRLWVVEGTLKSGARHVVAKKRFYLDEDSFSAGMYDGFDNAGKISRGYWQFMMQLYDKQVPFGTSSWQIDFATNVNYYPSIYGGSKGILIETDKVELDRFYSAEGLARRTQR
jgi:hypothetical protein